MKKLKFTKKFKVPIAYAKPDKQGIGFTKENLKDIANSAKLPMYITKDFNYASIPIGICTGLKIEENKLIADIELSEHVSKEILKDYCYRVGYTLEPIKLLDISKIDKSNDIYDKDDK